jgi:hypothetical protein
MTAALETNIAYFGDVAGAFLGRSATVQQYKLSRKQAFVALANLSDAFGRMLSEPRRQQKKITEMHQFVVSNHMLTSYIATLAYYEKPFAAKYADPSLQPVVDGIVRRLESAVDILKNVSPAVAEPGVAAGMGAGTTTGAATAVRGVTAAVPPAAAAAATEWKIIKPVVDQFGFISKVSTDIRKLSISLHSALTAEDDGD